MFKTCEEKGTLFKKGKEGFILTTDTTMISQRLKEINNTDATEINKMRTLAYFHDHKDWYERSVDLFFTRTGFYCRLDGKVAVSKLDFFLYDMVKIDRIKKELYVEEGNKESKKRVTVNESCQNDLNVLYDLIKMSSKIACK